MEAKWVFHPVQRIENAFHRPVSKPVTFRLDFWMEEEPGLKERCTLCLRAFRSVREARLNGKELILQEPTSWKKSRFVELSAWLRNGKNTLDLVVANPEGIPGLMVEDPPLLRTPGNWAVDFGRRKVVTAHQKGPPEPLDQLVGDDPGPFALWLRTLHLTSLVRIWLAIWSGLTLLTAIQLWRGKLVTKRREPTCVRKYGNVAGALILGFGLLLSLNNAIHSPPEQSPFDFQQHVEYIDYVSEVGLVANPTEGFQMYQPPLYYWLAAFVRGGVDEALKPVQYLGAVAGWALAVVTWFMVCRLMPANSVSRLTAVLFAVCLPMVLYMSPLVTNEVFSAAVIAITIYGLICATEDSKTSWKVLLAGVLAGLAMLCKYSAFFVLVAGFLWLVQQWIVRRDKSSRRAIFIYAGAALLICGWFYTRNLVHYGDPFVMAGDEESGFWYVQQPTYRTASFYYSIGSAFFHHPERAPWISFGDGHYSSLWGDLFRASLTAGDEQDYFWLGVVLLLAFAPSCAIFLGLLRSLRVCWRRPFGNSDLLLLAIPLWTMLALVSYSIELPFVSVIKAFFFLFLVPVLALHLAQGRLLIYRFYRPVGWVHDTAFLSVCGISVWLYCYPGG